MCNSPEQAEALARGAVANGGTSCEDPPGVRNGGVGQAVSRLSCATPTATSSARCTDAEMTVEMSVREQVARRAAARREACVGATGDRHGLLGLPAAAGRKGGKLPVVWYLSGLTCTQANVIEKGEYRAACAELGLIFVAPDTSPRGDEVPDDRGI